MTQDEVADILRDMGEKFNIRLESPTHDDAIIFYGKLLAILSVYCFGKCEITNVKIEGLTAQGEVDQAIKRTKDAIQDLKDGAV
jgi:hypothetical protein